QAFLIQSADGGQSWKKLDGAVSQANRSFVESFAFDPANADCLYAAQQNGDLFGSDDSGQSWFKLNLSVPELSDMNTHHSNAPPLQFFISMANLIGCAAMSHAPQLMLNPDHWHLLNMRRGENLPDKPGLEKETAEVKWAKWNGCMAAIEKLREQIDRLNPDVLMVVGDDQH